MSEDWDIRLVLIVGITIMVERLDTVGMIQTKSSLNLIDSSLVGIKMNMSLTPTELPEGNKKKELYNK